MRRIEAPNLLAISGCLLTGLFGPGCGKGASKAPLPFSVPEPPKVGIQIHLKPVTINPGEDREYCTYFNLDLPARLEEQGRPLLVKDIKAEGVDPEADEIAVDRIEVAGAQGLHHIQLLKLENDTEDMEDRHIFECAVDLFGGPLTGSVQPLFFTQRTNYSVSYEPGVARILNRVKDKDNPARTRGTQLLYNFHYVNATQMPITAEVVVNFHTVDRQTVKHPVRSAWWNYIYFKVKKGMQAAIDSHGGFLVDVALLGMTSHQHRAGTLFTYRGDDGTEIYRNANWSEPSYVTFPKNTTLEKGKQINFRCEWRNNGPYDLFFGLRAEDEMCTAILEYYPVNEEEANAILEEQRRRNMGHAMSLFRTPVTLESYVGVPDELLSQVEAHPERAFEVIDREIICGIELNLKQLERQYGRAPDLLMSLQLLVEYLAPLCGF